MNDEFVGVDAYFPPKLLDILFDTQSRYKVIYGGRGGGRSWGVARALLIRGCEKPLRILCVREFMSSIADSVHKLLADQIANLGLEGFYTVEKSTIYGQNGTEFRFAGIRSNITAIKSAEGIDICWPEEAEAITQASWDALIPTIRKPGSEFYITFNPRLIDDETYVRFVVNTPPRSRIIHVNYTDNPFLTNELIEEMEYMKKLDYDRYLNIWEGEPRQYLEGAIFSEQIKTAAAEGRIGNYPLDRSKPVDCYFDMGRDGTAIWFCQSHGVKRHLIDYYENFGMSSDHYVDKIFELQSARKYQYGTYFLPHDGAKGWWGSQLNIMEVLEERLGKNRIIQLPRVPNVEDRINAGRMIFANCYFNDSPDVKIGLQCLRSYRWEPGTNKPKHDQASHGADAFTCMAMASQERRQKFDFEKFKNANNKGYSKRPDAWLSR